MDYGNQTNTKPRLIRSNNAGTEERPIGKKVVRPNSRGKINVRVALRRPEEGKESIGDPRVCSIS